jgi:hypothetical protein
MNNPSTGHLARPAAQPAPTHDWTQMGLWLVAAPLVYNVAEGAGVQTSSRLTLLVKSGCAISDTMGVSFTRGISWVSSAFKHRMQNRLSAHFDLTNRVTVLFTSVRLEADCVEGPQVLGYSCSASHAFRVSSGRDTTWLLVELMSIGYSRAHSAPASMNS